MSKRVFVLILCTLLSAILQDADDMTNDGQRGNNPP